MAEMYNSAMHECVRDSPYNACIPISACMSAHQTEEEIDACVNMCIKCPQLFLARVSACVALIYRLIAVIVVVFVSQLFSILRTDLQMSRTKE